MLRYHRSWLRSMRPASYLETFSCLHETEIDPLRHAQFRDQGLCWQLAHPCLATSICPSPGSCRARRCRRRRRLVGCSCCSGFVEQSLCCYMRARSLGASSSCLMHGGNTTQHSHTCGQRDLRGKGTSDVRAKGPPGPQGRAPVRRISIAAVASASCSH